MPLFQNRPNLKKLMERQDVQGLVRALARASQEARGEIIQILADIRDPRATEALMREAESGDITIRSLAASALQKVDPERKYIAAVHLLSDVHRNVRTAAISILAALGNPKGLDALIKTLDRDHDAQARAAAALAIGTLHDRRSLHPLIAALQDKDERVRIAAAGALGALGDRTALDPLMRMHESDPDPEGRKAAEGAISRLQQAARG